MSEGGTTKGQEAAFKRELTKRLKLLAPQPGQVLLLEMPQQFFVDKDPEQAAMVEQFANEIARLTGGRDIFLVPEGTIRAIDDPRKREERPAPAIVVPPQKIVLPSGVKL